MITIIGATGFTGTLISEKIDKTGLPLRLAARNRRKLDELTSSLSRTPETVVADVTDASGLKAAIDGSRVVINCAGPFTELGIAVVEACIKSGIHYLDITGEQQFISNVIERYGTLAVQNGATAIPSCAFEYALGDSAAALLQQELGDMENFEATYIIEGMYTSRGTKRSVVCALEAPAYQLRNGALNRIAGGVVSSFHHPGGKTYQRFPFPGGEVYLIPLHSPVKNISTYLTALTPPAVLGLFSKFAPLIARTPVKGLLNLAINFTAPSPKRTETVFSIYCRGAGKQGAMTLEMSGKDPYYLTAIIASQCAIKLAEEADLPRGVISASMLKGFDFMRSITQEEGVSWTIQREAR